MNKVCILGSMNMDLVVTIKAMPKDGETILAESFELIPGGKGANQAIAAKRSGAQVSMIGKIGGDDYGRILKQQLSHADIQSQYIFQSESEPTGMAIIMVNDQGNNAIVVMSGANMAISHQELDQAMQLIKESEIIIAQFETPEATTLHAFQQAKKYGKVTVLNPAPAREIQSELYKVTDIIIPNETEAQLLTGVTVNTIDDAKRAGEILLTKGVKYVIITLGAKGAAIIAPDFCRLVPACVVCAVDTTAAGDCFIGGLSATLDVNNICQETLIQAVTYGNRVSSIAVQREGAQPSIPTREEVIKVYGEDM